MPAEAPLAGVDVDHNARQSEGGADTSRMAGQNTSYLVFYSRYVNHYAQVVKLADTQRSGRCARKGVEVQVLSWAQIYIY